LIKIFYYQIIIIDKLNTIWEKRGVIDFVSKTNSKNNKATVKFINENFDKNVLEKIKNECELRGTYLIRMSIAGGVLFSSMRAVNQNI